VVAAFFAATGRDGASRVPGLFPARANPGHVLLSEVNPSPSLLLPGLNRGPENVGPDHSDFSGAMPARSTVLLGLTLAFFDLQTRAAAVGSWGRTGCSLVATHAFALRVWTPGCLPLGRECWLTVPLGAFARTIGGPPALRAGFARMAHGRFLISLVSSGRGCWRPRRCFFAVRDRACRAVAGVLCWRPTCCDAGSGLAQVALSTARGRPARVAAWA